MFRWMKSSQPDIDSGITHMVVSIFALIAVMVASVAVGIALYKDGDGTVVASDAPASPDKAIDVAASPPDGFEPHDPTLAPAPGGTEHQIELRATEEKIEVAPGVTQDMWTFGGTVPGPVLRGKIGDLFTVTLINDGKNGHSIDFHASEVAPDDEMRTIGPGESLVYQFQATHSGIWMYHCGTPPVLHHVGNGMYGAVVIDPPDLAPVDHEYLFVQSEIYLEGVSEAGHERMLDERWDAVVFNGYVNQYVHQPIRVEPEETIRAWVLDAGPSENSTFHVIGTIFDTVYKEGHYELRPDASRGGSQALDLQAAQGGFVEFTLAEQGAYPFLTHKLATASKGALGIFQAGEPRDPDAAPSH
jgi:nitrite reductase (NO-forming)